MQTNESVVILSYANTPDRLDILRECINSVKSQGYSVILSSSYQVPDEIQILCDYTIFDKENPVITGSELEKIGGAIFFWLSFPYFENQHCVDMNHSYAVLKLMKNAAAIAKINRITKLHYLNYDYIIQDIKLLPKQSSSLDSNDLFYYYYTQNENYMNTGIFSVKTQQMLESFAHINSKSDYCDQGLPILEEFMLKRFKDRNLSIDRDLLVNIREKNKIDLVATSDFLTQKKIDGNEFNLYLYLSKEQTTEKLYLVAKSDIETYMNVRFVDKNYNIQIGDFPLIIELDNNLVESGFEVIVSEFQVKEKFDSNKKQSSCNIHNYQVVQHFDNFSYDTPDIQTINKNVFLEKNQDFYSLSLNNQTDKVYYHGYHHFYPQYFDKFRYEKFNLLEIGYGDGASMKTWIEYFPDADITVMDINVEHIESDRCRVIKGDQSKKSDLDKIINSVNTAKLIIDDGSHNPVHQFDTFNYLFKNLLEPGGVYIIEDIEVSYWNPESTLYGYESGYFNLIDSFKKYQEMINSEFTGVKNYLDISSITFGQNCIIITKRTKEQSDYFNRTYRFNGCVEDVCHFGKPEEKIQKIDVYQESLHDIAKRFGTDKAEHLFTLIYDSKFSHLRSDKIKFIEIGLWLGSSIRMWREYFQNAEIYGADLLAESEMSNHVDNINKTQNLDLKMNWNCDFKFIQLNQENEEDFKKIDNDFDIIIEDGGHTMLQQQLSIKNLITKLKSGGFLVIEDVHTSKLVHNSNASEQIYGATSDNTTLRLLEDLKNKQFTSENYFINQQEFLTICKLIDTIEIIKTQRDSITCIIKKI